MVGYTLGLTLLGVHALALEKKYNAQDGQSLGYREERKSWVAESVTTIFETDDKGYIVVFRHVSSRRTTHDTYYEGRMLLKQLKCATDLDGLHGAACWRRNFHHLRMKSFVLKWNSSRNTDG